MENSDFIEVDFCIDCMNYEVCSTSIYGIEFLEKLMIFKALKDDNQEEVEEIFHETFEKYPFTYEKVSNFLENKKENCIYFG